MTMLTCSSLLEVRYILRTGVSGGSTKHQRKAKPVANG